MSASRILARGIAAAFPGRSPGALRLRARAWAAALANLGAVRGLVQAAPGSSAAALLAERPQMLGALLWPYQNAGWGAGRRLARIAAHCRETDRLGAPFPFPIDRRLVLADLGDVFPEARLVLDQPKWFMREGGLTLNLFVGSFRAYSLAFSLFRDEQGRRAAYIGAIQGRSTDEAPDLYRDLTRAFHGIRPRDLMIESLRILLRHWQVSDLLAVSNDARHHRHPYFSQDLAKERGDYDVVWHERGGLPAGDGSLRLPLAGERRPMDEIKPNKRSMYRQRYDFLDRLEPMIVDGWAHARPVSLPDS